MTTRQIRTEAPERAAHHYAGMADQARRDSLFNSVRILVRTPNGRHYVRLSPQDAAKYESGEWRETAAPGSTRSTWAVCRDLGMKDQIRRAVELQERAGRAETAGQAQRLFSQADKALRGLDKRFLRVPGAVELMREAAAYNYEPGHFAATPDTTTADAFQRGMELGRKLERQDAGVHIHGKDQPIRISWEGFEADPGKITPFTPPAPPRTAGRVLLGLAVLAFVVAAVQVLS